MGHRQRTYGAFEGVFTPTLLTILGVIMFLRQGWVVGNVGLAGAWLIMGLSVAITLATALSLSSITTNIRIGAGGPYSIISQSLGLEVGGAIGIPLFVSQALVVAMYIFGFREGWQWFFPEHNALAIDLIAFAVVFAIASVSTKFAFRLQFLIMAVIAGSLVSVGVAAAEGSMTEPITWVGDPAGAPSFWVVFAVFFPAVTGIMAGANMSGELSSPQRAIPRGTLSAIALSSVIYFVLAYWLAKSATTSELRSNFTVMIDKAAWSPMVAAGLLGATFSSALASIVGAPRILQALGSHRVLPYGSRIAQLSKRGEPRNAMWISGAVGLAALLVRDLNVIAPLVSMFFLLTYAMINVVMLIEQRLGQLSFRPTMRIPIYVPVAGSIGCFFAMFIINAVFSLVAVVCAVGVYAALLRRNLKAPFGDSRSGLFVAIAEWAAKKVSELPDSSDRAWKPNLLVPVEDPGEVTGVFRFITSLTYPRGGIKLLGLTTGGQGTYLRDRLPILTKSFEKAGVFASSSVVEAAEFEEGVSASLQALSSAFFKPNLLFTALPDDPGREQALACLVPRARNYGMGAIVFADHPMTGLGLESTINLWVPPSTGSSEHGIEAENLNLGLLVAYVVAKNWQATLNLITVVDSIDDVDAQHAQLHELTEVSRVRGNTDVVVGDFYEAVNRYPADLNIFGMQSAPDFALCRTLMLTGRSSAVFVRGSGVENALA